MADYKRLVSYIYAYPGGVRDKNVGFAKAEVRNGQFKLAVSIKGVYTDTPKIFGVYVMVDKQKHKPGGFTLLKTGTVLINQGMGQYQDIFNPLNINQSGYKFEDISGIALAMEHDEFYRMFSLWEDCILNTDDITIASAETLHKSHEQESKKQIAEEIFEKKEKTEELKGHESSDKRGNSEEFEEAVEEAVQEIQTKDSKITASEEEKSQIQATQVIWQNDCKEQTQTETDSKKIGIEEGKKENLLQIIKQKRELSEFEKIFINADFVDAFDDDYFYDCIEVAPERLKKLPVEDEAVINNSFLVHGYYNFKHILFGKVRENDNGTHYFIGVPGMYCNRERFMASMFGFRNFKKSHRSDCSNPYFGYWYQEI